MFIYKISNKVNNKIYIGQSIRPIKERFKRHINDAVNNILDTHLARAIRKYGKENFDIELIDIANTQDELNYKEQQWIRFYDSTNTGYNETDAIYKCGGDTYKYKTKEDMKMISSKIRISKIGENNPNAHAIKCLNVETNEEYIFDTVDDCRIFFKEKTHRFITTRVTHKTNSLYQNKWNISYIDEEYVELPKKCNKSGRKIEVQNLLNHTTYEFISVRLASRELHINRNIINKHIKDNEKQFIIENYKFTILN